MSNMLMINSFMCNSSEELSLDVFGCFVLLVKDCTIITLLFFIFGFKLHVFLFSFSLDVE